jgi:hypothetical protein
MNRSLQGRAPFLSRCRTTTCERRLHNWPKGHGPHFFTHSSALASRRMHGPPICGWLALGLLALPLDLVGAADLVGPAASIRRAGFPASCTPRLRGGQGVVLVADGGSMEHLPPGTKPPRFVPSYEWQRVLPGQAVPPGLWIKMDISSGTTYAKFIGV